MYCPLFTGVYDKRICADKILFAKSPYNLYDYEGNVMFRVYIKKFYIYNDKIYFKYLRFGQRTENTGALNSLRKKQKRKCFKLTNYKCLVDFLEAIDFKNERDN